MTEIRATLWFDGASRGNPGVCGAGAVLVLEGREIPLAEPLLHLATNQVAEYTALIHGLRLAGKHGVTHLEVRGDSEWVIRQMLGKYRVKTDHIRPLNKEAVRLSRRFQQVTWSHVPREENAAADRQSNLAADQAEAMKDKLVSYEQWLADARQADGQQQLG